MGNKFLDRYARGEAQACDIDDEIENWHQDFGNGRLHAYLGMTKDAYAQWVRDPAALPLIAAASQRSSGLSRSR